MQLHKRWLIAGAMILSAAALPAQTDLSCYTCGVLNKTAKGKTKPASHDESQKPSTPVPQEVKKPEPRPQAARKPEPPPQTEKTTELQSQAAEKPEASLARKEESRRSIPLRAKYPTVLAAANDPGPNMAEVRALRDLVAAQQKQLEDQNDQLRQLRNQMQQVSDAMQAAKAAAVKIQSDADNARQSAAATNEKVQALGGAVTSMKAESAGAAQALEAAKKAMAEISQPTTIRYKGISLTPGGFVTADTLVRSRNENADVTSNFGATPFAGVANSQLSEFRASARATRLTLLAEGMAGKTKFTGYYEIDFLGQAPNANQVQTNSFNPRQRQLWAQAAFSNGFTITAGQFWSLLTTNRKGIAVRAEFVPNTIEGSYVVGYNYLRQTAFRFTRNFNDRVWAAFEVANPETNQPNASFVPANLFGFNNSANAGSPNGNTLNFLTGSTNGFSTNLAPDLLAKVAWEPGWGHYEFKALGRFFRDRINGQTNHAYGGGAGAAAILPIVAKKADLVIEGLAGNGIGRYGAANGSDITLRPDGMMVPIHAIQLMSGLELHPQPKLDLFLYGGDEYFRRAPYVNPTDATKPAGYGSPLVVNTNCGVEVVPTSGAACGAQNKDVWHLTGGFWYRAYKGPFGTFQYGGQYEYLHRTTWSGVGGAPQGADNVVMTSVRYLLP
jgi:hypothetical protein